MNSVFPAAALSGVVKGYGDYKGPSGTGALYQVGKAIKEVGQGKADKGFWESLNMAAGGVFHYPALQLQRTIEGVIAYKEGKASPPAILLGPPAKKK